MKNKILGLAMISVIFLISFLGSEPSYNDPDAGCAGSNCHSYNGGDISAEVLGDLQVEVTLAGVQSGENVAGELVDMSGAIVDVFAAASTNPFILTAPSAGKYLVNAGYKKPGRNWDSVTVDIAVTGIDPGDKANSIVKQFELYQNYPNPFNPSTTIAFALTNPARVILKIYNHVGQEITTLVETDLSAGSHRYTWDASRFATGVYVYEIQVGDRTLARRMTLVR